MLFIDNYDLIIKYVFIIILYSIIIFIEYAYINIDKKELIEIDNEFKINYYENEISFFNQETNLKPIAIYHPQYTNISYYKYFNKKKKINRFSFNKILLLIKAQVNLAKRHKIYGFAIYFNIINPDYYTKITMNIFLNKIEFPFLLIWKNDEIKIYDSKTIDTFIQKIKKYLIFDNYIKINDKPILSINNPYIFDDITKTVLLLRKIAKKYIGEIFLIYPFKGNYNIKNFFNDFNGIYDFSNEELFTYLKNRTHIMHYSGFIYKNLILNKININMNLFRTCYLNYKEYNDYKPEKFYIMNNIIFKSIDINNYKNKGFLFINSWNNYKIGNYLEYDEVYGYASINAFSKSILNLSYKMNNDYLLDNHELSSIIAIQIHAFYTDKLIKILNRINLIPIKYDLYISTTTKEKKEIIEKYLLNSNANKFEVNIFLNKGRDVYPFITQMKKVYKNYKYICHLHTKKSMHKLSLGSNWAEYLYNNLIGSKEIISNILYDFETNENLGFIFPEIYYEIEIGVKEFDDINFHLHKKNKIQMNDILLNIFHKFKVNEKIIFPVGNMFWAKTKAIYQIFNARIKYPEELGQTNETIMHAIERIWLYLVKLNGYYYKTILKHY